MTDHLYYNDSFLYEFDAVVLDAIPAPAAGSRPAVILDRSAFYPTSGGQVFDTGWFAANGGEKLRVVEVIERDDGNILHFIESPNLPQKGSRLRGLIDSGRRRDHMQQHSGQHVLSAAFLRLFEMPTLSFHMSADYCSIDLDTKNLASHQVAAGESLANDVIAEDRPVKVRFVSQEEARGLGLRKVPPTERDQLRLIDIEDFDLTACGGTHVRATGQIGCILLRKTEKVRQGWRVEFVCGRRAVSTARRDYTALTEAAALFSAQIWDVPQQIRKLQEESRASKKAGEKLLEELAELQATQILAETAESNGRKIVVQTFHDRDIAFIKLLAQRLTRQSPAVIALLAATSGQTGLVFAQSLGQPFDMGALMKEIVGRFGGRGGGTKDMAQGGLSEIAGLEAALGDLSERLRT